MNTFLCVVSIVANTIFVCIHAFLITHDRYVFSPSACELCFSTTPKDFFDLELEIYNHTVDFRRLARVNRKGSLILCLTKKQRKVWSDLLKRDLDALQRLPNTGVDVSFDRLTVTVYGNLQTIQDNLNVWVECVKKLHVYRLISTSSKEIHFQIKDDVSNKTEQVWAIRKCQDIDRLLGWVDQHKIKN